MKLSNIEFVNHASVILSHNNVSILSDPWFNGPVFNEGWRLLHEVNVEKITNLLKDYYNNLKYYKKKYYIIL